MNKFYTVIFVGLNLGLAWAIRGSFGHEWGAAWAGGIGGLAVIVIFNRQDWNQKAPLIAFLSAIGWGVGGMMSYGKVIGYTNTVDFGTGAYGYTMLALIGALYGFIGGGFTGLGLESSAHKKPDWAALITQMVAGAYLSWGLLIYQLEWLMTPPRSELWAACFGASAALFWYFKRNGFTNSLRVALYAALGAGFGFAFGDFIKVTGGALGPAFNWWNVMEFTLGFCGGVAMAYAIATSRWDTSSNVSSFNNRVSLILAFLVIPFTVYVNAFDSESMVELAERLDLKPTGSFVLAQQITALALMLIFAIVAYSIWIAARLTTQVKSQVLLSLLLVNYLLFVYLVKGIFKMPIDMGNSVHWYLPMVIAIFFSWYFVRKQEVGTVAERKEFQRLPWLYAGLIVVLLVISYISIHVYKLPS
ncbi:hypothetical protein QQ020_33590 [Fulvivirgaceae bacterium BMA12]|uniref:Uncharacterized protein n=1 Tax=Agaribacillus aureus TaxID=3051825 RepID=A0ABT8LL63_9BACT|nr:hypothetical protein [Fulvivirgaceae bacterium BMA12]